MPDIFYHVFSFCFSWLNFINTSQKLKRTELIVIIIQKDFSFVLKKNFTMIHEIWLSLINYNFPYFYDFLFLKQQKIDDRSWDIYVFWCRNMFLFIFWIIRNFCLIRLTSFWGKA